MSVIEPVSTDVCPSSSFLLLSVSPLMLQSGRGWPASPLRLWVYSTSDGIIWTSADSGSLVYFTNAVRRGRLVGNNGPPILITHPNVLSICRHECSGPFSFFRCPVPKYARRLKHRLDRQCLLRKKRFLFSLPSSVNQDEWPASPFYSGLLSYLPNDTCMCSSILTCTKASVRISHLISTFFFILSPEMIDQKS